MLSLCCVERLLLSQHIAVDGQNGGCRVVQQRPDRTVERAELREQFAHVLRAAARGRLIGHAGHPLHQSGLVEGAHAHEHAAHGAVAADPVVAARVEEFVDHRTVHRVEDDHAIVAHAQRRRRVDPVTCPSAGAQLVEHGAGVVAALRGDDDVATAQLIQIVRIVQHGFIARLRRRLATCVAGAEEQGLEVVEITLLAHALHQHRADHATPADQTHQLRCHHVLVR